MRTRALLALLLLPVLFTGCAKRKKTWRTPPPPGKYVETGVASWYGHPYHGRATASGEIYDMEKLTAAHRTLPFNTWVRVENLSNHRKIDVKVNDRGPFVHGRIIDLSRAAARRIEMLGPGTVKVRITSIQAPKIGAAAPRGLLAVQIGAFSDRGRAETLRGQIERRCGKARLALRKGNPAIWRVLAGELNDEAGAANLARELQKDFPNAFVVRLDAE